MVWLLASPSFKSIAHEVLQYLIWKEWHPNIFVLMFLQAELDLLAKQGRLRPGVHDRELELALGLDPMEGTMSGRRLNLHQTKSEVAHTPIFIPVPELVPNRPSSIYSHSSVSRQRACARAGQSDKRGSTTCHRRISAPDTTSVHLRGARSMNLSLSR